MAASEIAILNSVADMLPFYTASCGLTLRKMLWCQISADRVYLARHLVLCSSFSPLLRRAFGLSIDTMEVANCRDKAACTFLE